MASVARVAPSTRPGDRRVRIRATACSLFYARGFASVSIDDIASAVGISAPAVYRHYRSKQDLLEECVGFALSAIESVVEADPPLEDVIDALARLGAAHREFGILITREAVHLEPERRVMLQRIDAICVRFAQSIASRRRDLTPASLAVLARGLLAMAISSSFNPLPDLSPEYLECSRRMMTLYCADVELADSDLGPVPDDADSPDARREWLSRPEAMLAEAPVQLSDRGSYESTTLASIAAAVGLSGPTVYRYFSSKADLFQVAATRSYAWSNADLERALAMSTSGEDVLRRALGSFVALADSFATVAIEPEHVELTGPGSLLPTVIARNAELWRECVCAARPDLDPVSLNAVTFLMLGLVNGLRRGSRGDRLAPDVAKCVEIVTTVVLHI